MAWNKNSLISTHTITQAMIDQIMAMGPRGYEWLKLAGGGSIPVADSLVPVDSNLAEVLLARGPRAAFMAQVLTGDFGGGGGAEPGINAGAQSNTRAQFTLTGNWEPGTVVRTVVKVYDPDQTEDEHTYDTVIPEGAPEGGWDSATAASVVAADVDAGPHIRAFSTGAVVTIETADEDYTQAVQMAILP